MGWMRTLLLGDIGNRLDIEDAEYEIESLKERTQSALTQRDRKIKELTTELGRQKLATQALARFLVSKGIINQDKLDAFITEVDAEDGIIDGQMSINPNNGRLRLTHKKIELNGKFMKVDWT